MPPRVVAADSRGGIDEAAEEAIAASIELAIQPQHFDPMGTVGLAATQSWLNEGDRMIYFEMDHTNIPYICI
jgi:hypothetical protein